MKKLRIVFYVGIVIYSYAYSAEKGAEIRHAAEAELPAVVHKQSSPVLGAYPDNRYAWARTANGWKGVLIRDIVPNAPAFNNGHE